MFYSTSSCFFSLIFKMRIKAVLNFCSESEVAQSCPTLCDPMDCSLPGSSVHGIFQAIVLEWIAISFSMGSSRPRDRTRVSCIVGRLFTIWATKVLVISFWFSVKYFGGIYSQLQRISKNLKLNWKKCWFSKAKSLWSAHCNIMKEILSKWKE